MFASIGIEGTAGNGVSESFDQLFRGFKAVGTLVYSWPDAYDKAQAADRILRAPARSDGAEVRSGLDGVCGRECDAWPTRRARRLRTFRKCNCALVCVVRIEAAVERFTKEIAPLILTGPPAVTGFAGGRPKVEEIVAYWPALIPKEEISGG